MKQFGGPWDGRAGTAGGSDAIYGSLTSHRTMLRLHARAHVYWCLGKWDRQRADLEKAIELGH